MKKLLLLGGVFFLTWLTSSAQPGKIAWDNTFDKNWPEGFEHVTIPSSADGKLQDAVFYQSPSRQPQPLIVSLHTWSGDFRQEDPLAKEVLLRGWNYIHPDFRGPNFGPEACGSDLVISDIADAIRFAVDHATVDREEVHLIGVSGGGYAALLAYLQVDYPVKSFSAWAAVADLERWYWECRGRQLVYASHLEKITGNGSGFEAAEARKRSPVAMDGKINREKASLHIYTGIHDGYTGSVPISHSLRMYNKVAAYLVPGDENVLVSDSVICALVTRRINPFPAEEKRIGDRLVHFQRQLKGLSLDIFEGGHEMIVPQALALLPVEGKSFHGKINVLTIGDSNGAFEFGWPAQLRKLLPFSTVVNFSFAGNTIGFDNLGQAQLNTLKNIEGYLEEALAKLDSNQTFDYLFLGLGTNDTKRIFADRQQEVAPNLALLIQKINRYFEHKRLQKPALCLILPPPLDERKADVEKYGGADKRIRQNNLRFQQVANSSQTGFLDIYSLFKATISDQTTDGVHLTEAAQFKIAEQIVNYLNARQK